MSILIRLAGESTLVKRGWKASASHTLFSENYVIEWYCLWGWQNYDIKRCQSGEYIILWVYSCNDLMRSCLQKMVLYREAAGRRWYSFKYWKVFVMGSFIYPSISICSKIIYYCNSTGYVLHVATCFQILHVETKLCKISYWRIFWWRTKQDLDIVFFVYPFLSCIAKYIWIISWDSVGCNLLYSTALMKDYLNSNH